MLKKLAGLTAIAGLFIAGTASAQITGTAHDFSGDGWNATNEICAVCHTPHNSLTQDLDKPLWNHTQSTTDFSASLYASDTLDATLNNPQGISRLCMSCHDGSVALDSFGTAPTSTTFVTGDALLGLTLAEDHPVSFTWDNTLGDAEIVDPAVATSGLGGTIAVDLLFGAGNDQMECGSCHDVHGTANPALLRVDNSGSAFCLTCHSK